MGFKDPEYNREYARNYYYKRKQQLIDKLGDCCVECGSKDSLEFDHVNREDKAYNINDNLCRKDIDEELAKCQLLCHGCHKKKTVKEQEGWKHGTIYSFMKKKCKCDVCLVKKREWYDKRNLARRKSNGRGPYKKFVEGTHGNRAAYRRGCRCDLCNMYNAEKTRKYRSKKKI